MMDVNLKFRNFGRRTKLVQVISSCVRCKTTLNTKTVAAKVAEALKAEVQSSEEKQAEVSESQKTESQVPEEKQAEMSASQETEESKVNEEGENGQKG